MTACPPNPPNDRELAAAAYALDPCSALPMLEMAMLQLASGQHRTRVRFQNRDVEYSHGDAKVLQAEIRRLRVMCGANPYARARQATGPAPLGPGYPAGSGNPVRPAGLGVLPGYGYGPFNSRYRG